MSEYESLDLFRALLSDSYQLLYGFIGLVYGFLVVSYLVSEKLSNSLSALILTLYTLISIFLIGSIYNYRKESQDLYFFILEQRSQGVFTDIDWFGEKGFGTGTIIMLISIIGAFLGSLLFYRIRRGQNGKDT